MRMGAAYQVWTVDLGDGNGGDVVTYQIVGDDEADMSGQNFHWLTHRLRALIGKYAGDTAVVQAPGGVREYEIIDVR